MPDPVIIGNFGKVFGVQGWIKINSFTSPPEKILKFKPWLIANNGVWEELLVADSRIHFDSVVVKLATCDSPESARKFTNKEIGILRQQLPKLKGDEFYWVDLLGLKVVNSDGVEFGVVSELLATGANDVLIVKGERETLIPYISSVVLKVDLKIKTILVDWEIDAI